MVGWHHRATRKGPTMRHEYIYHRHLVRIVAGTVNHVTQTAMVQFPNQPVGPYRVPLADIVIRDLVS